MLQGLLHTSASGALRSLLPCNTGHTSLSFVLTVYACGYLIWVWHWRHGAPPRRLAFWQVKQQATSLKWQARFALACRPSSQHRTWLCRHVCLPAGPVSSIFANVGVPDRPCQRAGQGVDAGHAVLCMGRRHLPVRLGGAARSSLTPGTSALLSRCQSLAANLSLFSNGIACLSFTHTLAAASLTTSTTHLTLWVQRCWAA